MTTTQANDTLYYEVRGSGVPILLIPGTPGDGAQFDTVAEVLARGDAQAITYDRAATARSGGAVRTSVREHADDAARLLRSLTTQPAVVYGTSNGALVALEVALAHPGVVRRVVLHEAALLSVLADPEPVGAMLGSVIGPAMERGGPADGLDAFLRFAYGDDVVDSWPTVLHERATAAAPLVFEHELPSFQAYRPDESALAALAVPVTVVVGRDQMAPFFREAAEWIARRTDTTVVELPGAHGPQFTHPDDLAALLASR